MGCQGGGRGWFIIHKETRGLSENESPLFCIDIPKI